MTPDVSETEVKTRGVDGARPAQRVDATEADARDASTNPHSTRTAATITPAS